MPAKLSPRISINFQNKLSPRASPVKSFGSRHKDSARPVWERTDVVRGPEERKNEGQNVLDLETWKNICGKDRSASGTLELIRRHCLGPPLPSSPRYSEYNTSPTPSTTNSPIPPTTTSQTQSPRSYESHRSSPISQTQSPRIQEIITSQSKESPCIGPAMIAKSHKTRGSSPEAATPERPPRRPYQRCEILGMLSSNPSPNRTGCDPWTGDSGDLGEGQTPDRARKCLEQSFQRAEPQRPSIRRNNSSRNNESSADKIKAFYSSSSSSSSRSNSPEPPPPPQNPVLPPEKLEQEFFPPPPGFSTLKRISSECSRTRRQRIRSPLKEQDITNSPLRGHAFDLTRSARKKMEEGNPNSPSRTAAKEAAGWEKFHGRRSVSVTLTAEEAEIIRVRRRQEIRRPPSPPQSPVSEEPAPPPLPPKPRHKISEIGSPNSENFIVMDNSAAFSRRSSPVMRTSFEASAEDSIMSRLSPPVDRSLPDLANNLNEAAGDVVDDQADHPIDHHPAEMLHCRSDSGLSSMSERTSAMSPMSGLSVPFRATSSSSSSRASVRSSSIVSSCSIPLEEMLGEGEEGGSPRMSEMKTAATNKAILEKVKYFENEKSTAANKAILEKVKYFENESSRRKMPVQKRRGTKELKERRDSIKEETVKCVEDEDLDVSVAAEPFPAGGSPTTTKDSGVQRQLDTIKQQKENLIREIVINENHGLAITEKIELAATYKEMDKYRIFVTELDKILSLLLSLSSRLQRAEGDLCNKNMTDYEKERIRFHRDKLNRQLGEAQDIKKNSDRRMTNIVLFMQKYLAEEEVNNFKMYIKQKEELLKMQRAYEDSEKTILHCF